MLKRKRTIRVTSYPNLTQPEVETETPEQPRAIRQTRSRTRSQPKPQSDTGPLSQTQSDSHVEQISAELHRIPEHLGLVQAPRIPSEECCGSEDDNEEVQASIGRHLETPREQQAPPMYIDQEISGKSKGTRGFTSLSCIWNLPEGTKVDVQFNSNFRPIKREGGLLRRFLGTCVRRPDLVPINFIRWRKVPSTYKDGLWDVIKSKFEIPVAHETEIKKAILQMVGYSWRGYKSDLKARFFDVDKSAEENIANVPPRVDKEQWASLVAIWNTSGMKTLSQINKALRQLQKTRHTSGSKSFADVAEEKKEKDGVAPSEAELYILTHTRKDGTPVNEEAAKKIAEMKKLLAQQQENDQSSNEDIGWQHGADSDDDGDAGSGDNDADDGDTHALVMEESNDRAWGLFSGITPRKTPHSSPAVASTRIGSDDTRQVDMETMRGTEDSSQVEKYRMMVVKDRSSARKNQKKGKEVIGASTIPSRNTLDFSPVVAIARLVTEDNTGHDDEERVTLNDDDRSQVVENRIRVEEDRRKGEKTKEKQKKGPAEWGLSSGNLPSRNTSRLPRILASAEIVPEREGRQVEEETIRAYEEGRKQVEEDKKRVEEDKKRVEEDRRKVEEERKQVEEERRQAREDRKQAEEDRRRAEEDRNKYEAEISFLKERLTWTENLVGRLLPSTDAPLIPREVVPRSDPSNRARMFSATSSHAQGC